MKSLDGLRILVTRPAQQALALCDLIEDQGGHCLRQPLFSIEPPADEAAVRKQLADSADADLLIFTSRNAVEQAWVLLPDWQPSGRLAAIGEATRQALALYTQATPAEILAPVADFRSEALLALPTLQQLSGKRVVLVTGEGGRSTLREELSRRGAELQNITVYRRQPCKVDEGRMQALLDESDAAVVTSGETLQHLVRLTPAGMDKVLRQLQLVVPSNRVLKMALDFGFERRPLLPEKMNNEAIVAVLQRWARLAERC